MLTSVLIDQREPDHIRSLQFGGIPVAVTMLDAGDLVCTTDDDAMLAIERKTPGDFLNTLKADRLFTQCQGIRAVTPWAYLVITGQLTPGPGGSVLADGRATGWAWASVAGALLTVQELGVHVLQLPNEQAFEQAIVTLGNRNRDNVPIPPARNGVVLTPAEAVLAALPGVGPERADAVLRHCGSAGWALSYLTRLGENGVPGIGDGIKQRVRQALGVEPGNELTIIGTGEN